MIEGLWFGVFGAIFGSAANALIYRLPRQTSWTRGKSICPGCKHQLEGIDLIPLFSYILLKGKCRYCRKDIGASYFWLELFMTMGFGIIGFWPQTDLGIKICLVGILWTTTIIAVMDSQTKLVSEWMVVIWAVFSSGLVYLQNGWQIQNIFLGVGVTGLIVAGIWAISKGKAMGFGDVEIALVMGLWLGWQRGAVALWMAFVTGAVWGGYILFSNRSSAKPVKSEKILKQEMAFGPFLIAGAWIAYFWGDKIFGYVFRF